ncbi:MAG: siderophore-interacting protein [Paracoccus sp. (in: a-proteobacteria)]|uniref:siderophore-interacting protein n=1 Tax=Paracoccus sp. TaxID=267 RepID=UPI0039E6BE45
MVQMANYKSTGFAQQVSGAAVAALKTRAAEWEIPILEQEGVLVLWVWGGEIRVTLLPGSLKIDLSAPEKRLIGYLRDSTSEILAETGIAIEWSDLDVGALAPGLSLMTVRAVSQPLPNFLRVRVSGPEAARFATGGLHFRLLLPPAGRAPVWPRVAASGRTDWPEGKDALHRPVYTVLNHGGDWLDFDIFRHDGSPTCDWAEAGPVGQTVGLIGPGGGWCPEGESLRLFGDETALPAIIRILDLAKVPARAWLRCAPEDLGPLAGDPRVCVVPDLLAALQAEAPDPEGFTWFAADTVQARAARKWLQERRLDRTRFSAMAYWG